MIEYSFTPPDDYSDPDWARAGRVHDWKNYIGVETINIWHSFTDEQKAAIAIGADKIADREEWD